MLSEGKISPKEFRGTDKGVGTPLPPPNLLSVPPPSPPPRMQVKNMMTAVPFILESLMSSSSLEVQDDKIRSRGGWANWLPFPKCNRTSLPVSQIPQGQITVKAFVAKSYDESHESGHWGISKENKVRLTSRTSERSLECRNEKILPDDDESHVF